MKTSDFVKENGISASKLILSHDPTAKYFYCTAETAQYWLSNLNEYHTIETAMLFSVVTNEYSPQITDSCVLNLDELRRILKSIDMVMVWRMPDNWRNDYDGDLHGLIGSKMYLEMYGGYELVGAKLERFEQAIKDVESII